MPMALERVFGELTFPKSIASLAECP